jgi:hypothetical protein
MNSKRKNIAVKDNVPGDFYVEDGCCTLCGVPHVEAPNLFGGFDENGKVTHEQCFVKKQPTTLVELNQIINTMAVQDTGCIKYCGRDQEIIKRIREVGEGDQIDWE